MRLTPSLLKKVLPNGHLFIGKRRLEYEPKSYERTNIVTRLMIEEQNILLLKKPFLTFEQSRGHSAELQLRQKYLEKVRKVRKSWWEPVRLEDKLNHLRHSEQWDV